MATNKIKWKFMKKVEKIIQDCEGIIFGGYVRDKIIHDHYATEFYKKTSNSNIYYNDTEYDPENKLRLIIPNDIDCFLKTNKLAIFKSKLAENMINISIIQSSKNAKFYIKDLNEDIMHTKWKLNIAINPLLNSLINTHTYDIYIDIMHRDNTKLEPPFGLIDFESNSLILTANNEYKLTKLLAEHLTPKDKLSELNRIMDDIIKKKTRILYVNTPDYRIENLVNKGWIIESANFTRLKDNKENICFICLEDLTNDNHIKFNCCNGRMHSKKCSEDVILNGVSSCPMCRFEIIFQNDDKKLIKY
jgi:hypothetical protein